MVMIIPMKIIIIKNILIINIKNQKIYFLKAKVIMIGNKYQISIFNNSKDKISKIIKINNNLIKINKRRILVIIIK